MNLDLNLLLITAPAALLFILIFVYGEHVHVLRLFTDNHRSIESFTTGMSIAYVFMHMMPELHEARETIAESESIATPFDGLLIYYLALIGFLAFLGNERLRLHLSGFDNGKTENAGEAKISKSFLVHMAGLFFYIGLMSYLLVRTTDSSITSIALFAFAFGGHFLVMAHGLIEEHAEVYQRYGRWILALGVFLGWLIGVMTTLPETSLAMLTAFLAGGVIMINSMMELPANKEGRFVWFAVGGLLYGLLLLSFR
jgi:hypothetical protein